MFHYGADLFECGQLEVRQKVRMANLRGYFSVLKTPLKEVFSR
jgi:hypothetical protein